MDKTPSTDEAFLKNACEAVLIASGDTWTVSELASFFDVPKEVIESALGALGEALAERGVRLIAAGDGYAISTATEYSDALNKLFSKNTPRDLTPAALEALALVLYRSPIARAEIDYIRGVNSGAILRNLEMRDLITASQREDAIGEKQYEPTTALLAHLGVSSRAELPNYAQAREMLGKALTTAP